jgi:protein-S-isoprenylcysteine O-methyltransferase Ste14
MLKTLADIDRSSWTSWLSYYLGFVVGGSSETVALLAASPASLAILFGSIAAFFAIQMQLQRYMQIALTSNTFGTPQQLVTGGAFQYSRNPIYLAFLVPIAGLIVVSPLAVLVAGVAYVVAMSLWVIPREEQVLAEKFPAAFADYCSKVRRWI